jgi:hypothetical protein
MKKDAKKEAAMIGYHPVARIGARIVKTILAAVCFALPLIPAVKINLDAAVSQGEAWTYFAIGSVAFAALCVDTAIAHKGVALRTLAAILAAGFLLLNVFNALGNAAAHSEHGREDRTSQIREHAMIEQQRLQWSQAREELAAITGSATPDSIEADMQAAKAADAPRWKATEGCNVEKITAGPSKTFCASLARLEAKKAAAVKRDELDAKLASLNGKDTGAVPESADPFAANVARMLGLLDYTVTDDGKVLIASLRDWGKAVGVELLAGFGPALLMLALRRMAGLSEPATIPRRKVPAPAKGKTAATTPELDKGPQRASVAVTDADAEIEGFVARRLEFVAGEFVASTPLFQAWCEDCAEHGREPGAQKGFTRRIKGKVKHEANGGRPRFVGVRLKEQGGPRLRVVAG